jgi:hypothetical protein
MNRSDRKALRTYTVVDSIILERDPEKFVKGMAYLAGLSMPHVIAILEERPQEDLQLFSLESWAWWLRVAPPSLVFPLQRLALRRKMGPRYEQAPVTDDHDLLNGRDYVCRKLFRAWQSEQEAEAQRRLARRQASRAHRAITTLDSCPTHGHTTRGTKGGVAL